MVSLNSQKLRFMNPVVTGNCPPFTFRTNKSLESLKGFSETRGWATAIKIERQASIFARGPLMQVCCKRSKEIPLFNLKHATT